jgi:hypothetical protein
MSNVVPLFPLTDEQERRSREAFRGLQMGSLFYERLKSILEGKGPDNVRYFSASRTRGLGGIHERS